MTRNPKDSGTDVDVHRAADSVIGHFGY